METRYLISGPDLEAWPKCWVSSMEFVRTRISRRAEGVGYSGSTTKSNLYPT